jgi:hypothetical protein
LSPGEAIGWLLVWGIIAVEIALPLSIAFWLGRRWERRVSERAFSADAEAWLEERVRGRSAASEAATRELRVLQGGRSRRRGLRARLLGR